MGLLRLYLALCVVVAHSSANLPVFGIGGQVAVQLFYLISGFYMALVIDKYHGPRDFYISRALRIFPAYWVIAISIILISCITGLIDGKWHALQAYIDHSSTQNGGVGMSLIAISNLTLFFQDLVFFLSDEGGKGLRPTVSFWASDYPLYRFLVIPQSWTVAIELGFYLLAPLLCGMRTRLLFIVTILLWVSRIVFYESIGLRYDPWTYRFFPFELGIFASGILVYRFYESEWFRAFSARFLESKKMARAAGGYWLIAIPILMIVVFRPTIERGIGELYYPLVIVLLFSGFLPVIFALSKRHRFDRAIGEYSYPVYLIHFFVLTIVASYRKQIPITADMSAETLTILCMLLSIVLAAPVIRYVVNPLDKIRHGKLKLDPRTPETRGQTLFRTPSTSPIGMARGTVSGIPSQRPCRRTTPPDTT